MNVCCTAHTKLEDGRTINIDVVRIYLCLVRGIRRTLEVLHVQEEL